MNYNNKPNHAQANASEKMMSDYSALNVQKSRFGGSSLWSLLRRGLFVALVASVSPVMVYAGAGEGETRQSNIPADTQNQSPQNSAVGVQSSAATPIGRSVDNTSPINATSTTATPLDNTQAPPPTATQSKQSNAMLWVALAMLFFVLLGVIFVVYKSLERSLEILRRKNATIENSIVQLNQKTSTIKIKQQPDQQADSFSQRQGLAERVELLEEQIRQLKPQPISAKSGLDSFDDIPMLQSDLSINKQPFSKPLVSIDTEDRKMFQQAFSQWLSNSLTHQFTDFLSKELLGKIEQLGYEIVFAKAGLGLNRMIIDRKPPSKTCMVGLTGSNQSLMYCQKKTSQTDDSWRPNTWYDVSIDAPDAMDEQTIHQLEELPA